jgi:hypothetical protein
MDFYKKISVGELQNMVSSINWTIYFHIVFKEFIPLDEPVVVLYASKYIEDLERLIRRFDTRYWNQCSFFIKKKCSFYG